MDLVERITRLSPTPEEGGALEFATPYASALLPVDDGILMRLRRHKVLFVLVFGTVLALVAGAYEVLPAVYKATADVTITPPDRVIASQQASDSQLTIGDTSDLESQSVILSSPLVIRTLLGQEPIQAALLRECLAASPPAWKQAIRSALHMRPQPSCAAQAEDVTGVVAGIRNRLSVSTAGRSRVIDISFSSPLPDVAAGIANGIVQTYLGLQTEDKLQPRDQAIAWLHEETARIATRLRLTEGQVDAFLHDNGVIKGQTAPIASEQLTSLSQQLALAQADQAAAAGRMQQARDGGAATSGVLDNRAVSDVKQQLAGVTAQLAQMSTRYGASNPAMAGLLEQRHSLERVLGQETSLVARSTAADYRAATSRVASLTQQVTALKQDVRGNDSATTQVASLQRDAVTDRELLVDLTKNLNQLETDRRLVTSNARLVSLAELPQTVAFPKVQTFALTGLLLATALATITALLRDRSDRTFRAGDALGAEIGLRVLAHIPHVAFIGRASNRLQKRIQQPSEFQEAIRSLYAECMLMTSRLRSQDRPLHSIMVSSSNRSEGKTFTTLALAHFAVAAGQRVLLLECDLRRPGVGRSLSLATRKGVSEILRGMSTPEEAVCCCRSELDVILAGQPAMDSTELLGGPRMANLLDWATARYDMVLVDVPSSRLLPDARILAPKVDGILYCAQWGQTTTASLLAGVSDLRASGGRMLGLVLDRVDRNHYKLYDTNSVPSGSYLAVRGR